MKNMKAVPLLVLLLTSTAVAQVQVTTAGEDARPNAEDIRIDCPLQIDVPLNASERRSSFLDYKEGQTFLSNEMNNYVCHTERIANAWLRKKKVNRKKVILAIGTTVKSEQWRQDVDLEVSLLGPDGRAACRKLYQDLTVGKDRAISGITWVAMASSTKTPNFDCVLDAAKFAALFAGAEPPKLRLVLSPHLDDD